MPIRQIACGGRPVMSRSPKKIRPRVGCTWPVMRLNSVDLPAPFGPMTQAVRPRSTDRLTSWTATKPPNNLDTDSTRSSMVSAPAARRRPADAIGVPEIRLAQRVDGEDDPQEHDQQPRERRGEIDVQGEGGNRQGQQECPIDPVEPVGALQQPPQHG